MTELDVSIRWPFKWTLVGSSGSGKTNFSLNIVKNSSRLFDQSPTRIIIIYKIFQNIYDSFAKVLPTSLYTEDEINIDQITENNQERLLFICDDLYFSNKLNEISEHFLIKGRHRNTSWIVLTQSIFNQPALKNISRNSTHLTMFKNVRLSEPHILFSQLRPKSSKVLQEIYTSATREPFGYLDIDLSQTCPDNVRYKTDIFNSIVTVFCIMNDKSFKTMYLIDKKDIRDNSGNDLTTTIKTDAQPLVPETKSEPENVQLSTVTKSPMSISDHENTHDKSSITSSKFDSHQSKPENLKNANHSLLRGKTQKNINKNTSLLNVKRKRKELKDVWLTGNKSLNGNRKNNDISKSLIIPSDFNFLKSSPSSQYLKKWKPLKKITKKKHLKGRFKQWKDQN